MNFDIQQAKESDLPDIRVFIKTDWKEDHIFVTKPDFLAYHYGQLCNDVSFILALNSSSEIVGLLGYINFSPLDDEPDILLSLWKVRNVGDPSLGMRMIKFLTETKHPKSLSCGGINKKVISVYQYLGYHTGEFEHYFMPNEAISDVNIAYFPKITPFKHFHHNGTCQKLDKKEIQSYFFALPDNSNLIKKSWQYFSWRYLEHPIYDYSVFGITNSNNQVTTFVITRIINVGENSIIRIVDLLGDYQGLVENSGFLQDMLVQGNHEYIELTHAGLSSTLLQSSGFLNVKDDQDTIIPSYFEPFEKRNIDIYYFSSYETQNICLFLGDGDQDRPNA